MTLTVMLESLVCTVVLGVSTRLGLGEARALAERQSAALLEARTALAVAQAHVETAGSLVNPVASVSYGPDDPRFAAGLDVALPYFGQRQRQAQAARAQVSSSRAELERQRAMLGASVRRTYSGVLAAGALTSLAREAASRGREVARMAKAKFEAGSAPELEVEQADLAARRLEQLAEDRAVDVQGASLALATELGLVDGAEVEPTGALEAFPVIPPREALLSRAGAHPDVVVQERRRDAAMARVGAERAAVIPTPTVGVTLERLAGSAPAEHPFWGVRGSLSVDLPLLSWNVGAIHEAQAEAEGARAAGEALRLRQRRAILGALGRVESGLRRTRLYREQLVPAAERVEKLAKVAYSVGRAPLVSVLQAEADVTATRVESVTAARDAQTALAELEDATGAML